MERNNWCTFHILVSAAKEFVHKKAFDEEYGTKTSTRPAFVLNTDDDEPAAPRTSNSNCSTYKKLEKSSGKDRKRKYDLQFLIEKQHEDFMTKTTKMHEEKNWTIGLVSTACGTKYSLTERVIVKNNVGFLF